MPTREEIGKRMDALARQYAQTHDEKVKAELEQLSHCRAALRVLEDALDRCRDEDMRKPEVFAALDLLEFNADPIWPFKQFREALNAYATREWEQEGRWQTLNASLNGIKLAILKRR